VAYLLEDVGGSDDAIGIARGAGLFSGERNAWPSAFADSQRATIAKVVLAAVPRVTRSSTSRSFIIVVSLSGS
jgi:hypothetical protein